MFSFLRICSSVKHARLCTHHHITVFIFCMFCCGNSSPNKAWWTAKFFGVCSSMKCTTVQPNCRSTVKHRLRFRKAFKAVLGCFIGGCEMLTITFYFSWTITNIIFSIKFKFFGEKSLLSVLKVPAAACYFEPCRFPLLKISLFKDSRF